MTRIGFIICTFVIGCLGNSAGDTSSGACVPLHCIAGTKFYFEPGWSYVYNHEANVVTSISGTSKDFTGIFIESQVELHVVRPCQLRLKLRNVELRSRDVDDPAPMLFAAGHAEFKRALEERSIYFLYVDGVVYDVCSDSDETPWVLNVKRAIVSAFQNSAKSLWRSSHIVERDVQGDCPTDYETDFSFTSITVKKTKDLDHCRQRHVFISGIQSTPYTSAQGSPVSPALNSSYECKQTIEDGVIEKVSCIERHLLKPFSNGENGAQTMSQMTLVLIDQLHRPALQSIEGEDKLVVTSLLFDHEYRRSNLADAESALAEAESTLSELCASSLADVQLQTPQLFWKLRDTLRALDYTSLTKVFGSVDRICKFSPRGQKFFRDVLPMIGSLASVSLMKDFILDHSVPEFEIDSWLRILAFHPKPTLDIIKEVTPLLTSTTPSAKTFLTLSALVYSYCHRSDVLDCESHDEIRTFLNLIQYRLGHHCQTDSPEEAKWMVVALKAIGNLGLWEGEAPVVLERCILEAGNPVSVRLAAIRAYRKFSCHVNFGPIMLLFRNEDEDVEIRIAAYSALMKCPTHERIYEIRKSLEYEKVNQVNSFVWSHLDTLTKSSDPGASLAISILDDVSLNEKYASDVRKFSKAFGRSAFSEILNMGASIDGGIIYSPSAFLPRAAHLNLTVYLFGQSINLFEFDGRAQGLERLSEAFFRPEPPLDTGNGDGEPVLENARLNEISERFFASGQTANAVGNREISVSAKVFGQEVWHTHVITDEVDEGVRRLTSFTWMDLLDQLSADNSIELSRDVVLVDMVYAVPSLAGIPLILNLNATASVHLKFGGRLDIRQMAIGVCDIEGHIRPSAAVVIRGSMLVDGYVGQSGVKLDASMSTSTVLDGKLKLTSQGQVKVQINMPNDKLEFIRASTNLVLAHWKVDRPLRISVADDRSDPDTTLVNRRCSTKFTHQPLGVALCVQLDYVNASMRSASPYYPLTGPSLIDFYLLKTDPKLTSYFLEYVWHFNQMANSTDTILFSFRTPRSVGDREWTASYSMNRLDKSLLLRFLTPNKKVILKGRYFDDPTRRGLLANVDVDGREAFSFHSELSMDMKKGDRHYQPKVIVRVPTHTVLELQGLVRYNPDRRNIHVDLSLEKFTLKPIVFRGEIITSVATSHSRYECSFDSPVLNFSLKGSLNAIDGGLSSKTNLDYQLMTAPDRRRETIDFTTKLRYTSPVDRAATFLSTTVDVHLSAAPEYDMIAIWEYRSADGHLENTLTVDRPGGGDVLMAQIARFQQIISYNGTLEQNKVLGKLEVKFPSRDVFLLVNVDHQNTLQMLHSKMNFRGGTGKEYGFEVHIVDDSTETWMTTALFRLVADGRASGVSLSVAEERPPDLAPARYVLKVDCYGRLFGDANISLNYTNENQRFVFKHFVRLDVVGGAVDIHGVADLLLTNSRGLLSVDADVNKEKYRLNGDYLRLNVTEHEFAVSMRSSLPGHQYSGRFTFNTGLEKSVTFAIRSGQRSRVEGVASLLLTYDVKLAACHLAWNSEVVPLGRSFNVSFRREKYMDLTHTKLDAVYLKNVVILHLDHLEQGSFVAGLFDQTTKISADLDGIKSLNVDLGFHYSSLKEAHELTGFLDSYTPMFAIKKLALNASHAGDGRSWKSHGSFDVNDKFPLKLVSYGKSWLLANQGHTEAAIQLVTPIVGMENISMTITHDLASRETRTKARFQWTHQIEAIVLEARAVRPDPESFDFFTTTVDLTTPFTDHRHIRVGVAHTHTSREIHSQAYWNHDGADMFFVAVNGDVGLKGHYYEVTGNLTILTPLDSFDKFIVTVSHSHDSYGLRTDLVISTSNSAAPFSMRLDASRSRPLLFNLDVVGGSHFDVGLGGHWSSGGNVRTGLLVASGLHGHWNEMMVNASVDGFYNSFADFSADAAVDMVVMGLERTSLSVRNVIKTRSIESYVKVHLMGSSVAKAVVDAKWDLPLRFNVTAQLVTPFTVVESAVLSVIHETSDERRRPHRTSLRGIWNDLSLSADNSAVFHGGFSFEDVLLLSLPSEEWSGLALSVSHSTDAGSMRSFVHLHQFDAPVLTLDIDGSCSSDRGNRRLLIGRINAFSTFGKSRWMNISIDHTDDGVEYKPVVTWNFSDMDGPIVVTGYMTSSPSSKVLRLDVRNPIPDYESVGLSAMYSVQDTQVEWAASAQWRNSSRLEIGGLFIIDLMAPRLKLTMRTPIPGYAVFKVDGSYDVWSTRKEVSVIVVKEDWTIQMFGSGTFQKDFVETQLSMETSNPRETQFMIHLNASGQWRQDVKSLKTILSWGSDGKLVSVAIGLRPSVDGASLSAVLDANLGVNQQRNVGLSAVIRHAKTDDVRFNVLVNWDKEDSVDVRFRLLTTDDVPLNYSLAVRSTTDVIPFVMTKIVVVTSDVNKHRQIETTFQVKEQRLNVLWDLKYGNGLNLDLKLQTPFEAFRSASLSASISSDDTKRDIYRVKSDLALPIGDVNIEGTLQKPSFTGQSSNGLLKFSSAGHQPVTSEIEFRISDDSLDASIKSHPPLSPLWNLVSADVHYHRMNSEFVLKAFADVSEGQHAINGRVSRNSGILTVNATVTSTALILNKSRPSGHVNLGLIASSNGTFVSVFDGQETHSLELLLVNQNQVDDVKFTLKANSSLFTGHCSDNSNVGIHVTTSMSKIADGFRGFMDVSLPCGDRFTSNGSYEFNPIGGVVVLFVDVATPLEDFRHLKIDAGHRGRNWDDVDIHLRLITPIRGYEKFATAFRTMRSSDSSFDVDVFVDTPFRGYENISLSERLVYEQGLVSKTDLVYGGLICGVEVHHFRKNGGKDADIGVGGRWRTRDPYSEESGETQNTTRRTSVRFGWVGQKYLIGYSLQGMPWEVDGSWNYTGWRHFIGKTIVSQLRPLGPEVIYGVKSANNFPSTPHTGGGLNGQLGVQWGTHESLLLNYGGSMSPSKFEGSFNLTGPLTPILGDGVRFFDCHVATVRGARGIVGSATLKSDSINILDATLEWTTDDTNIWKNRTVVLSLDNVFQPLGIAVSMSKRSSNYWMLDSSVDWNLTHRDLGRNSANLLLEATGSSRRSPEKTFHFSFRHPRHRADLRTARRTTDANATLSAVLLWGSERQVGLHPLINCKTWWVIHSKEGGKLDAGLKWSHPGRTLLATGTRSFVNRTDRTLGSTKTELGFWWDVDRHPEKRLQLDWNYLDASTGSVKFYAVNAVLHSPRLRKEVVLNANVSTGASPKIFEAALELNYSPDQRDRLSANAALSFTDEAGYILRSSVTHENVKLESGLHGTWSRNIRSETGTSADATLWRLNTVDGRDHKSYITVSSYFDLRNTTIQFTDSENSSNAVKIVFEQDDSTNDFTGFVVVGNDAANRSIVLQRFTYKPNDPSLEADFAYELGKVLQLRAGLQSPTVGTFYIARLGVTDARLDAPPDVSFTTRLNTSRLVVVHCNWTSDFADNLLEAVGKYVSANRKLVHVRLSSVWKASVAEVIAKSRLIARSLATRLQPIADEAASELEAIEADVQSLQDHLENMYDDNDFLMQDILLFLDKWSEYARKFREALYEVLPFTWSPMSISRWVEDVLQKLDDLVTLFMSSWYEWSARRLTESLKSFSRLSAAVCDLWEVFGRRLYAIFDYLNGLMSVVAAAQPTDFSANFASLSGIGEWLSSAWTRVKSVFATVRKWITGRLEFIVSWLFTSEIYVYVYDRIASSVSAIRHFLSIQMFDYLDEFVIAIKRFMSPEQQKLMDSLQSTLLDLREVVRALPNAFMEHAVIGEIADLAATIYHKVIWILHYYELSPNGWQTLFRMYTEVTYMFGTKMEVVTNRFDSPNYVLLDPENRKFELVQTLPFPWTSLRKLPQFGQTVELRSLRRLWDSLQAAESDSRITLPATPTAFVPSIFVWWNDVSNRLDVRKWLPPFRARAMLIGHQHYVTFDDRITDFSGPCSYLLTRDFVDGNFTVSVNYNFEPTSGARVERRSLSIWLEGREIELLFASPRSPQVYVDGRKVELPQHLGLTNVIRDVHRVTVEYGYGFSVSCHLQYDVCTFAMSGWYLGRVGGLLGTYNYEASDDVRLPDGRSVDLDLKRWGDEWQIDAAGSSTASTAVCTTHRNLAISPPRKDVTVFGRHCVEHFNSSRSIFRICFDEVDPEPYFQMCLSDVQSDDTPHDICTVAAGYVDRCLSQNIPVRMPKLCVRCPLSDESVMSEGHSKVIQSTADSKKADVVFIIEAKKCNRNFPNVYGDFVAAVDVALARANVHQRRFATVAFGGSGFHDEPRIHTVDSQIFVAQRLISGLPNFVVGRGTATAFDAFRFAAKLPFEAGASKTFVLVACSIGDDVEMKTDYPEVHWLLLEDGITLHLLLDREFDTKKPSTFYGMDGQRAYTAKDARSRELRGDEDLRRQVAPPKDFHVPIALEVNGTVFSSARLYGSSATPGASSSSSSVKPVAVKRFLDVFGRRLAQSASADVCHHCECFPADEGDVGRLYCYPCIFPKPAHVYVGSDERYDDDDDDVSSVLKPGTLDKVKDVSGRDNEFDGSETGTSDEEDESTIDADGREATEDQASNRSKQ